MWVYVLLIEQQENDHYYNMMELELFGMMELELFGSRDAAEEYFVQWTKTFLGPDWEDDEETWKEVCEANNPFETAKELLYDRHDIVVLIEHRLVRV